MTPVTPSFPTTIDLDGHEVDFSLMSDADGDRLEQWAVGLPVDDLIFMRRDITRREEIDEWLRDMELGHVKTVLADIDGQLVGYASMHRAPLRWSSHVAELRVLVAPEFRRIGLGRALTLEIFNLAVAEGIEKMVARMTPEQSGARRSFEELGFKREALLREHVKDRDGVAHDLLIMSHKVAEFHAMMAAISEGEK